MSSSGKATLVVIAAGGILLLALTALHLLRRDSVPMAGSEAPAELQVPVETAPHQWRVPVSARDEYFRPPGRASRDIQLRPTMGVGGDAIAALTIENVEPDSPLYAAGFRKHDRILGVNGRPVDTLSRATNLGQEIQSSSRLTLQVEREGKTIEYRIEFEGASKPPRPELQK